MAEVVWTEPALSDLNDIAEYISIENLVAARSLVQKVFSAVERLESHPESGKVTGELSGSRYREVVVEPCRIFYRIEKDTVFILYVMRRERQLRNYIIDERANVKP